MEYVSEPRLQNDKGVLKKKKAKRSPERKFDNERGFYSKSEQCPDKISSNCLQYEYYLYFDDPMELTGWCIHI